MILYLDLASGASGDKLLSALISAGDELDLFGIGAIQRGLESVAPEARISLERVTREGLAGSHLVVEADYAPRHRHWSDIRETLEKSTLPEGAKARALAAFKLVAQAEAKAHGIACEDVHFHEVGATDSLVDMVGVSLALDLLGVDELVCSPIAVGSGTIECEHGTLPVPAPATTEILKGAPIFAGAAPGELTTPTGAALVMANVTSWGPMPSMRIDAIGYGAGTREIKGFPNILRVVAGVPHDKVTAGDSRNDANKPYATEGLVLLSSNIDHITAEEIAFAAGELLKAGALDVWQEPVTMKKGRLGTKLRAMAKPVDAQRLTNLMIQMTGTLGVRSQWVERTFVPREVLEIETPYGPCRYKVAQIDSELRARPEHDDIARISQEQGLPYREVADTLTQCGKDHFSN